MKTYHDPNLAYKCDECGKSFAEEEKLMKHAKFEHGGLKSKKKYGCDLCGKNLRYVFTFNVNNFFGHKHFKQKFGSINELDIFLFFTKKIKQHSILVHFWN